MRLPSLQWDAVISGTACCAPVICGMFAHAAEPVSDTASALFAAHGSETEPRGSDEAGGAARHELGTDVQRPLASGRLVEVPVETAVPAKRPGQGKPPRTVRMHFEEARAFWHRLCENDQPPERQTPRMAAASTGSSASKSPLGGVELQASLQPWGSQVVAFDDAKSVPLRTGQGLEPLFAQLEDVQRTVATLGARVDALASAPQREPDPQAYQASVSSSLERMLEHRDAKLRSHFAFLEECLATMRAESCERISDAVDAVELRMSAELGKLTSGVEASRDHCMRTLREEEARQQQLLDSARANFEANYHDIAAKIRLEYEAGVQLLAGQLRGELVQKHEEVEARLGAIVSDINKLQLEQQKTQQACGGKIRNRVLSEDELEQRIERVLLRRPSAALDQHILVPDCLPWRGPGERDEETASASTGTPRSPASPPPVCPGIGVVPGCRTLRSQSPRGSPRALSCGRAAGRRAVDVDLSWHGGGGATFQLNPGSFQAASSSASSAATFSGCALPAAASPARSDQREPGILQRRSVRNIQAFLASHSSRCKATGGEVGAAPAVLACSSSLEHGCEAPQA